MIPELQADVDRLKTELVSELGDPVQWQRVGFFDLDTNVERYLYQCPRCGAGAVNAYQHKAWHLHMEARHD